MNIFKKQIVGKVVKQEKRKFTCGEMRKVIKQCKEKNIRLISLPEFGKLTRSRTRGVRRLDAKMPKENQTFPDIGFVDPTRYWDNQDLLQK